MVRSEHDDMRSVLHFEAYLVRIDRLYSLGDILWPCWSYRTLITPQGTALLC
jgi:hypothetical protein